MIKDKNEILWLSRKEPLEITSHTLQGASYKKINGEFFDPFLSVEINGFRFIPETRATKMADKLARILRSFLEETPNEKR